MHAEEAIESVFDCIIDAVGRPCRAIKEITKFTILTKR